VQIVIALGPDRLEGGLERIGREQVGGHKLTSIPS
jgi:hypothetical protein